MRRNKLPFWVIPEEAAERMACVLGEASGAHKMLAEYRRRTAAGEAVVMFRYGAELVVGPQSMVRPSSPTKDRRRG